MSLFVFAMLVPFGKYLLSLLVCFFKTPKNKALTLLLSLSLSRLVYLCVDVKTDEKLQDAPPVVDPPGRRVDYDGDSKRLHFKRKSLEMVARGDSAQWPCFKCMFQNARFFPEENLKSMKKSISYPLNPSHLPGKQTILMGQILHQRV